MRSATELLRKYAADGAAPGQSQVKYNLKKVPLKGERVWGYGDVDDTYIDNWWSEYDKANAGRPDKLNRRDVEWQQRQLENKYKEQVDANRGMKRRWWNPLSWTGADNGAVNAKWLASEAARPSASGAQGVSELEDRIRNRTLFSNERQQEYRQADRRNTFAAHVTGQVLDAATMGIGANAYTRWATGEGIDDLASTYGRLYADDYGEDAARKAERNLRLAGWGAHAIVDGLWLAGGKAGMFNNMANWAQGGPRAARAANLAARTAQAYMSGNAAYGQLRSELKMVSDAAKYSDAAQRGGVTGALVKFVGGAANLGAALAGSVGAYGAAGVLGNAAGAALQGIRPVGTAVSKLTAWAGSPSAGWTAPAQWLAKKYVSGALNGGLIYGAKENVESLVSGNGPVLDPLAFAGPVMSNTGRVVVEPLADAVLTRANDTYAAARRHGQGQAVYDMVRDELSADIPALRKSTAGLLEQEYGVDGTALTDEQYADMAVPLVFQGISHDQLQAEVDRQLDGDFDWDGASPEVAAAHRASFSLEDRRKAKMAIYRDAMTYGGPTDYSVFADKDLADWQRQELLEQYLKAEFVDKMDPITLASDVIVNGLPFIGDAVRRKEVSLVMNHSEHARAALMAYGSSVLRDKLDGSYDGTDSGLADTVVKNLSPSERQQMLAEPLLACTPEQLAAFSANGGASVSKELSEAAEPIIARRMETDRNFAADYVLRMCANLNDGAGLSEADIDKGVRMLSSMDVDSMLLNTDPDRLMKLCRVLGSSEGREKVEALGAQGQALVARFREVMPDYIRETAMRDPLKNIPALAGLWAQSKGFGGTADVVSNPIVFYSMAALLLFGGFTLFRGLFSGSDDTDASGLMTLRKRQQESFLDDLTARK